MRISVLSGKGGTGKTFTAVNLSAVMGQSVYVDCDVEEPNGNLFFRPEIREETKVTVKIPQFDKERCTGCKKCIDFCAFHALAFVREAPLLFPTVCHSCGGCQMVCEEGAVSEIDKEVGLVQIGKTGSVQVLSGTMNLGEVSGVPIIKSLLESIPEGVDTVVDCPPGSGCMVMESVRDADYCVLVAEPTEFGRHNLEMVYELTQVFHKKTGVILNKCLEGEKNPSEEFCKENHIEIIGRIPYDQLIAEENSKGMIAADTRASVRRIFSEIRETIEKKVRA